eukprot:TRINITY_DN3729_c0_g1_i1.p1 TRINITY_DN3729_c0_g1~~TRINITY_DN3729_c0_g1_i1.p1  ORF type:complete len:756 (-),score=84.88 TRINITY_DN3729_c0_g1_i1:81-2348(-)
MGHVEPEPLSFTLEGHNFMVAGHPFLLDVPSNILMAPSLKNPAGCFIGFESNDADSRHVVPLGKLLGIRFMSIFRFKVFWSTHWVGNNGSDVENETQIMILDKSKSSGRPYVLLLPLIEGSFRACLQPGTDNNIELCVESGSTVVKASSFKSSLYMHAGEDPFNLVKDGMKVVRAHLGTFKLLEEKTPPGIVDKFGWCTWDAFYLSVHPQGILEGIKGLADGGFPPALLIVDDGWQSTLHDDDPISDGESKTRTGAGEQIPCRLIKYQENRKFQEYEGSTKSSSCIKGMKALIRDIKSTYDSVENVYVWHSLSSYWGGIRPNVPGMPESRVVYPQLSPGALNTMNDLANNILVANGVGIVPHDLVEEMYEGFHSYLASVGIDGVKVDSIQCLDSLCEDYGGRVELQKSYYNGINTSVKKHFKGNGVIASMQHCNDFMFLGTETICLGRVGDDFWCTDPKDIWLQGCHMVHCAYNSIWMGQFIHPDWDMFQSTHPSAEFHAASRAISGGPIYVSDFVGKHDFQLLKTIVLPDGTILRCEYYALPTRDCLFEDPLHDGKTMLKIWNLNKFTGVLGAFNCQGGGWCREERRNKCYSEFSLAVESLAKPNDIEWKQGKNPIPVEGVESFAVYMYRAKELVLLKPEDTIEISLEPFNFELFTVSPVKIIFSKKMIQFAPIGLVNMLNSGGAIRSLKFNDDKDSVQIEVKGTGGMGVFSSEKPKACQIDGEEVPFDYDGKMVLIQVPWPNSSVLPVIEYLF